MTEKQDTNKHLLSLIEKHKKWTVSLLILFFLGIIAFVFLLVNNILGGVLITMTLLTSLALWIASILNAKKIEKIIEKKTE